MPIKSNFAFSKQQGLTLVEILVAMVLGVFLIGSVLEAYLSTKQSSAMQDNLSRLQENGRLAIDVLSREIRLAGFHGDVGPTIEPPESKNQNLSTIIPSTLPVPPNIDTFISGTHGGQPNFWSSTQQAKAIPDTDTITIIHASSCGAKLVADMANRSSAIQISNAAKENCNINKNDALLITNNRTTDIFFATNDNSTSVSHAALSREYSIDAELFNYYTNSFYIGTGANGNPSLYRYDNVRDIATELVGDVEDMQILYGIDSDSDSAPNIYVNAEGIGTNARNIVSVKISIVIVSMDAIAPQPIPYTINGTTVIPTDNKIRRVFTTTLSLRNRGAA